MHPPQTRMNPHFCEIPFLSLINAVAHHRRRTAKTGCASRPCLCRRMDNWEVGRDMWTSLQNARLDHMSLLPPQLPTRGLAFGLTRFACQTAVFQKSKGEGDFAGNPCLTSVAPNRCAQWGQPTAPQPLPFGRPTAGARALKGAQGAQPRGSGGGTPHAEERPRRGPEAGGLSLFGPLGGA